MRLISDDALATITIWQEARGEPFEGKVAVGEVIRNRTKERGFFSDGTVAGTILRANQFSGWNSNDPNRLKSVQIDDDDELVKACRDAWGHSATSNLTHGALYYMNVDLVRQWNGGTLPRWWLVGTQADKEVKLGDHTFRRKR